MKICVFGAGAVGGTVAAYMANAGLDVTLIARGTTLAAVRDKGLILRRTDDEIVTRPKVTDDTMEAGVHDIVITTLKVPAIRGALDSLKALIGTETTVVPAQNGIPWWYFYGLQGDWPKRHLDNVDPGGIVWKGLGPEHVIGCVVGMGASVPEPGVISHTPHRGRQGRFPVGEPDGTESERVHQVSEAFKAAGFGSEISPEIRNNLWHKLLGNVGANPISVLTLGTMGEMHSDDLVADVLIKMMRECFAVSEKLGATIPGTPEERIEVFKGTGAFRTSSLQDLDKGRPMEVDAIVGAVSEMGRMVGVETPLVDAVYALTRLRAELADCYQAP
jgi:2-dehydropantoate 2-reductase